MSASVQVSRIELDWLVGMSHKRLWGLIVTDPMRFYAG